MTQTASTDIRGPKVPTGWASHFPRALKIETTPLNPMSWMGNELFLLGRADPFLRAAITGVDILR